ncbi:hypothetical protein AB833_03435 [Chromatiales bacterium (ex Bugula neritina AB1)]|nr:hypothetical protein AB833_03435 [Chromatiales bacterium (ex Bugula neritina AB1)]
MAEIPKSSIRAVGYQAGQVVKLGVPICISMAALIGLGVTDTVMAGFASTIDLAALGIGANVYFIAIMLLIGLQSIVAPRIAWRLGSNNGDGVRNDCWQAIWIGLLSGSLAAVVVYCGLPFLYLLKLEADVQSVARQYLLIVLLTLPMVGMNMAVRNTIDGLGLPSLNMWISMVAFLLNGVLDYLFVFGRFGFPQLGALGCAIATFAVVVLQTITPVIICQRHRLIKEYRIFQSIGWPDIHTMKVLVVLGFPAALSVTMEESFFASTSILVAPMGTTALATHQVVLTIAMVSLVFPISMGQSAAILIGQSLGRQQADVAGVQAKALLLTVFVLMALAGIGIILSRDIVMTLFTRDQAVIILGATLLSIVAVQLLVDGMQIGSNIALKGFQDTLIPAACQIFSYWIIGFPLAWALTRTSWFGEPGGVQSVWLALFASLSVAGVLGVSRLLFVSREFAFGRRQLAAAALDSSHTQ